MAAITPNFPSEELARQSAAKYHIPFSVLWGVSGVETSHGTNISTSSAGAKGWFQFIAPTAQLYNYPYTNATDANTLHLQADAAAHYLSDLYHQHGSWDAALKAYSGGGYGWSQVAAKGGEKAPGPIGQAYLGTKAVVEAPVNAAEEVLGWVEKEGPLKLATTVVLLLAGAVLVVYGIMVAVRPRESAFDAPDFSKFMPKVAV
jgi:Transglycosylase SLT domain